MQSESKVVTLQQAPFKYIFSGKRIDFPFCVKNIFEVLNFDNPKRKN